MKVIRTRAELRAALRAFRREQPDATLALVPTMGYLHEGHLTLIRDARARADLAAVSIFVNPLQFNDPEDYKKYPINLERDLELATAAGADLIFAPERAEMYPEGDPELKLSLQSLEAGMEGAWRPGHFPGVMLVVLRLFHLFSPDVALFGKKDYQQYQIIRRLARDLDMPIEVIGSETVRDEHGLALSSRNARLSERGLDHARLIFRAMKMAENEYRMGLSDAGELKEIVRDVIESGTLNRVEYVEFADCETLQPLVALPADRGILLAVAAFCEGVRLIDNREIPPRRGSQTL
jgi:pantoate--beta-alanine ligase